MKTALTTELLEAPASLETYFSQFFLQNAERYGYGEFFEPLYQDLAEFVCRKGKRIRPMLFLLGYRIFEGDRPFTDPQLLRAATSLELLHAFILIHDDVIDRSERRRGLPTFHKLVEERMGKLATRERVGHNVAVVVGDMLFALAMDTMLGSEFEEKKRQAASRRFLRYVTDTGAGEVFDILLGVRDIARVKEEDIALMYTLKTTRYTFEAPLVLGAILAGALDEQVQDLAEIVEPLGLAFQIQNDLIEYSHFDLQDRALQTDLLEGKKTMLLRYTFDRLESLDRSFLQLCLTAAMLNESSIVKIKELIDKSGAVEAIRKKIEELLRQAQERLNRSGLTENQRQGIRDAIALIQQQTQVSGTN
jgi:geranylgeranyl diphosphate synthase type I